MLTRYSAGLMVSFAALLAAGCSHHYYNPAMQTLPQHITSIAVRQFTNHSKQSGIEQELTMAVEAAINRDGRFRITSEEEATGVVIGDITRYIMIPMAYDSSHVVTQVKLWVLVDVTFYDKVHQQTLWQEKNLEGILTYARSSTGQPGGLTVVEAERQIGEQLARTITTRTVDGFGTVTGASEKAVPKSSIGQAAPPLPQ